MAKDPAFLFYPGDYLRDTQCLSEKVQVAYDRIMCEHMRKDSINERQFVFFTKKLSADEREELSMVLTKTDSGYQIEWVVDSIHKRKAFTESRRKSRLKGDEDNVRIYIVRDNIRSTYKIGSSVNPVRRFAELSNQKNPAIMQSEQHERDLTLIWYSDPIVRIEEKKLHKHFSEKNITGEWFSLNDLDLKYIYSKFKGTYVQRTENENENEIEDINTDKNKNATAKFKPPEKNEVAAYMAEVDYPGIVQDESENFINFYESKGWMIGKNKMKSWQAAVRTWKKNRNQNDTGNSKAKPANNAARSSDPDDVLAAVYRRNNGGV